MTLLFRLTTFIIILISKGKAQEIIVNGIVVNNHKIPVESTYIYVINNDSTKTLKTLTDNLGFYSFSIPKGKYKISFDKFGKTFLIKDIDASQDMTLDSVHITENILLDSISVIGRKKVIETKIDRLVFNTENVISLSGGNALDALQIAPRVNVQNEKISIIGKGNVLIMLNNKIIPLDQEDLANYLKSINSDNIKSIEIITNPPSKYTAEGNSGLINIITKDNYQENSWNASIRGTYQQATYARGSYGASFNTQLKRYYFSTSVDYSNGSSKPIETSKIFYPTSIWDNSSESRSFINTLTTKSELTYKINNKLSTGITYSYLVGKPSLQEVNKTVIISTLNNRIDSTLNTIGTNNYERKIKRLNYSLSYDIDTTGKKIVFDADYFKFVTLNNRDFTAFSTTDELVSSTGKSSVNKGTQSIQNYSFNLDIEHPTLWMNLNYGIRLSNTSSSNSFTYFDNQSNQLVINDSLSDKFKYNEKVQAIYFSIDRKITEKLEFKTGLRYEYTQTKGYSELLNIENRKNYSKFFPTAYIKYSHNENHSFNINYGKRIRRPSYSFLNPFRWYSTPYSYTEGNPNLTPAYINNIELTYEYGTNYISNVYFTNSKNDFQQIAIYNNETQQIIPLNFISNNIIGFDQTIVLTPIRWWNLNANVDIYYTDSKSSIEITTQQLNGWNSFFSISNDFSLNKEKSILFNTYFYLSPKGINNLDKISSFNQLNLSLKWINYNKTFSVTLHCNDVFSSNRPIMTNISNSITSSYRNYYDQRYFRVSLSYNLKKAYKNIYKESKNDQEYNRL